MHWNSDITIKHNIPGFISGKDAQNNLSKSNELGLQVREWVKDARSYWLSTKRISPTKAIKDFLKTGNVKEYYVKYRAPSKNYSDDSIEIFYKENTNG